MSLIGGFSLYLFFVPSRQEGDDELLRVGLWRFDFPALWFFSHSASASVTLSSNQNVIVQAPMTVSRIKSLDYPIHLHPDGCDKRDGEPANSSVSPGLALPSVSFRDEDSQPTIVFVLLRRAGSLLTQSFHGPAFKLSSRFPAIFRQRWIQPVLAAPT